MVILPFHFVNLPNTDYFTKFCKKIQKRVKILFLLVFLLSVDKIISIFYKFTILCYLTKK